jgi:release factor glutamine methyltransferase
MEPTVQGIVKQCEARLAGVDSPRLSAQLLVAEVLGLTRLGLSLERDLVPSAEQHDRILSLVDRRAAGEPVAYILGRREFYGLDFTVTPDVLIPRPETEHIVEAVEERFTSGSPFCFADLGTGSGILAVTIASLFPQSTGVAVDRSAGALGVARSNACTHGVESRLSFVLGDFTLPLLARSGFDLIVSNPPYVTESEYEEASHEVTAFEPISALVSGRDGLDHVRALLPRVRDALRPGGVCLMEIGAGQAEQVQIITSTDYPEFEDVIIIKDLAGHDRVVFLRRK